MAVFRPFHNKVSSSSMNRDATPGLSIEYGGNRRAARSCARREAHAHAPFPKGYADFIGIQNLDEFHVGSIRECRIVLQPRPQRFHYTILDFGNKQRAVRI